MLLFQVLQEVAIWVSSRSNSDFKWIACLNTFSIISSAQSEYCIPPTIRIRFQSDRKCLMNIITRKTESDTLWVWFIFVKMGWLIIYIICLVSAVSDCFPFQENLHSYCLCLCTLHLTYFADVPLGRSTTYSSVVCHLWALSSILALCLPQGNHLWIGSVKQF